MQLSSLSLTVVICSDAFMKMQLANKAYGDLITRACRRGWLVACLMEPAFFLLIAFLQQVPLCFATQSCSSDGEGLIEDCSEEQPLVGPVDSLLHKVASNVQGSINHSCEGIFITVKTTVKYHDTIAFIRF